MLERVLTTTRIAELFPYFQAHSRRLASYGSESSRSKRSLPNRRSWDLGGSIDGTSEFVISNILAHSDNLLYSGELRNAYGSLRPVWLPSVAR
jgi:hypothetical protein